MIGPFGHLKGRLPRRTQMDKPKSRRGFAAMSPEKQLEIARKGGEAVSRDRQHMTEIGRKGGDSVSRDRQHMAEIGREGGLKSTSRGRGSKETAKQ